MAREITVSTWCDPCLAVDVKAPGVEVTVTLNRMAPLALALCLEHHTALLAPLDDALRDWGQVAALSGTTSAGKAPSGQATPTGRIPCPVDGCGGKALPRTMAKHLWAVHHIRAADARDQGLLPGGATETGPSRGQPHSDGARTFDCGECGRQFSKNQGRAQHLYRAHKVTDKATRDASMALADAALRATG